MSTKIWRCTGPGLRFRKQPARLSGEVPEGGRAQGRNVQKRRPSSSFPSAAESSGKESKSSEEAVSSEVNTELAGVAGSYA